MKIDRGPELFGRDLYRRRRRIGHDPAALYRSGACDLFAPYGGDSCGGPECNRSPARGGHDQSIDLIRDKGLIGKYLTLRYSGLWALLTGKTGLLMGNYGGDDRTGFVSRLDIADAVAEELLLRREHTTIRYVGSEESTCNEAAKIIGEAIGKPWRRWVPISLKNFHRFTINNK